VHGVALRDLAPRPVRDWTPQPGFAASTGAAPAPPVRLGELQLELISAAAHRT